jgi:hypothetical protein
LFLSLLLSYYIPIYHVGIFYAPMEYQYWVTILWYCLIFCTSLPLTTPWQMLLAKLESARIYVSVSLFAGVPSLPCKLKEITTIRQVLTREMKSATLLSRRVKKQGYRSQKSSIKASKISGWVEQYEVVIFNSHVVQVPSCMHRSNCQPEWACQWLAKHRRQRDCWWWRHITVL